MGYGRSGRDLGHGHALKKVSVLFLFFLPIGRSKPGGGDLWAMFVFGCVGAFNPHQNTPGSSDVLLSLKLQDVLQPRRGKEPVFE